MVKMPEPDEISLTAKSFSKVKYFPLSKKGNLQLSKKLSKKVFSNLYELCKHAFMEITFTIELV